jgi:hypothetical protein
MFHYIVLNIIYIYVCARFVDIIIRVLLVGDVDNPGPGLRQAQKCVGVKLVNGIPTLPS